MKKILVPTDFSKQSDYALETACQIAQVANAKVIFMHVVEAATHSTFAVSGDMSFDSVEEEAFTLKLIERAKEEMAARKADPEFYGEDWEVELQVGNAYHGIKSIIVEHNVDMVVMGTSGASGFDELLLGSTTEKVVRYAKCPVLTVHKKQTKFEYKDIVFATSLHEDEQDCLKIAKSLQDMYDSTIHMVRINTPNNFERDVDSLEAMKRFAENADIKNYTTNVFNDISEEDGIVYFADFINADLIVMPTHGRTGLAHLLSGSIAEDVVSNANRPVLTQVIKKN